MLEIEFSKRARKFLLKIPAKHAGQITRKAASLTDDPFPPDSERLQGFAMNRVDIGEYRIIYFMVGKALLHVYLIGKRNDDEVYKQLKRLGG